MTLKKLTQDHYIIVDDSEIREGDWLYSFDNGLIVQANKGSADTINSKSLNGKGYGKITHSTQPESLGMGWMQSVLPLLLSEVKELIGEVDVEKRFWDILNSETSQSRDEMLLEATKHGFKYGYNQAIEDNKDRKYTEEQLIKFADFVDSEFMRKYSNGWRKITNDPNDYPKNFATISDKELIEWFNKSLQPKTEWNVDFVDGKLKLK